MSMLADQLERKNAAAKEVVLPSDLALRRSSSPAQPIDGWNGSVRARAKGPRLSGGAVNNLLVSSAVVSSETVVTGVKAGLDPRVLIKIINVSSRRNSATQDKFPRVVLPRTFDFGFATGHS